MSREACCWNFQSPTNTRYFDTVICMGNLQSLDYEIYQMEWCGWWSMHRNCGYLHGLMNPTHFSCLRRLWYKRVYINIIIVAIDVCSHPEEIVGWKLFFNTSLWCHLTVPGYCPTYPVAIASYQQCVNKLNVNTNQIRSYLNVAAPIHSYTNGITRCFSSTKTMSLEKWVRLARPVIINCSDTEIISMMCPYSCGAMVGFTNNITQLIRYTLLYHW